MAKSCPKLYLHFSPAFPALNMAGEVIVLDPAEKGGCDRNSPDSFWVIGKLHYSDIRLLPPEEAYLLSHYNSISRLHCTLRFEPRTKIWSAIDGAIYLSDKDTQPGEEVVTASTNGVYINGQRIRINDWCTIEAGDRIHFGNDKRLVIHDHEDPTINNLIWEDENWVCRGSKEVSDTPLPASDQLLKHTQENANPVQPTTSWSLLGRIFDWFIAPSRTRNEHFLKLMLAGSGVAISLSSEFRHFLDWLIHTFIKN